MERHKPAPGQPLGQLLARLHESLGHRAEPPDGGEGRDPAPAEPRLGRVAAWLYALRRERAHAFPAYLFGEAAWDILLHLYQRQASGLETSVEQACAASGIPGTASHRWLTLLEKDGFVCRYYPETGERAGHVCLTGEGVERMGHLLGPLATALPGLAPAQV